MEKKNKIHSRQCVGEAHRYDDDALDSISLFNQFQLVSSFEVLAFLGT